MRSTSSAHISRRIRASKSQTSSDIELRRTLPVTLTMPFVPLAHPSGHAEADFGNAIAVVGGECARRPTSSAWTCRSRTPASRNAQGTNLSSSPSVSRDSRSRRVGTRPRSYCGFDLRGQAFWIAAKKNAVVRPNRIDPFTASMAPTSRQSGARSSGA